MDQSDIQYLIENNLSSIERLLSKISDTESVRICMKNIRHEVKNLRNNNFIHKDRFKLDNATTNTKSLLIKTDYTNSGLLDNNEKIQYNGTNEMKQLDHMNDSIDGHREHIQYLTNISNTLRTDLSHRPSKLSINEQKKLSILENISYVGGLLQEHKKFQDLVNKNTTSIENKSNLYINTSFQDEVEYKNYNELSCSTEEDFIDDRLSNYSNNDEIKSEVFCASNGKPLFLNNNDTLEGYWLQGPIFDQEDNMNSSFNTIGDGNNHLNYHKYNASNNLDSIEDGVEIYP